MKNLVGTLAHGAFSAARHPVGTTARALGLVKGAAETGIGLVRRPGQVTQTPTPAPEHQEAVREAARRTVEKTARKTAETAQKTAEKAAPKAPAKKAPAKKAAAKKAPEKAAKAPAKKAPAKKAPAPAEAAPAVPEQRGEDRPSAGVPLREPLPAAPQRTPEELASPGEPFVTEPKAATRDSAHGGQPGDREEVDGFVDEVQPDTDAYVGVETPVGTSGAGAAVNPDTAEADLQQPDTPPLLDPSLAKEVRSESEILQKAADPDKGPEKGPENGTEKGPENGTEKSTEKE